MKKFTKRAAALLLSLVLVFGLAGCYSEDMTWAAKMDDTTLPIGSYIYFLSTAYNEASAKVDTETKVLDTQIDGVDAEEWILNRAEQHLKKFFYIEQEMDRLGLEMEEADYDEAALSTNTYWTTYGAGPIFEEYGIAKSSFDLAYSQYNVKFLKVFEALYGEGGELEVPEEELLAAYYDSYYNYEYFTVPMALPDEEGNPVEMTEEELADLTEDLEEIRKNIKIGVQTVEEAAEEYAAMYDLEDSSYVADIDTVDSLASSYLPTSFTETLTGMKENDVAVFEATSYMVVLKRLPISDTKEEFLASHNGRLSVAINLKTAEYNENTAAAAEALEGIEMNTKAISRYQPKMFADGENAYGLSSAETTEEEETTEE